MRKPLTFTMHEAQKLEPLTDRIQRLDGLLDPRGPDAAVTDALADSERDNLTAMGTVARVVTALRLGQVWNNVSDLADLIGLPHDRERVPHVDIATVRIEMDPVMREEITRAAAQVSDLAHGYRVDPADVADARTDLTTHRASWRLALIIAREAATEDGDHSYWQHELNAFDRTFKALTGHGWSQLAEGPAMQEAIDKAADVKAAVAERDRLAGNFRVQLAKALGLDPAKLDTILDLIKAVEALKADSRADFVEALREALGAMSVLEPNDLLNLVRGHTEDAAPNGPQVRDDLSKALGLECAETGDTPPSYSELIERVAQARIQWSALPPEGHRRGVDYLLAERVRQIVDHGRTPEWDDRHTTGGLVKAALSYCTAALGLSDWKNTPPPSSWPWDNRHWKPTTRRRNLEKVGALIAAELERMDREGEE